jgi:hypothetical protein
MSPVTGDDLKKSAMAGGRGIAQPFLGWLDYDERDAQRMREVFAAFDDKDTIDSLGLGVIRDSISDQLFPGISTIQTRARYFLVVPWVCQILEAEHVPPNRFTARLREPEVPSERASQAAATGRPHLIPTAGRGSPSPGQLLPSARSPGV